MSDTATQPNRDALAERLSATVPRYTSYPTAPHFHEGIDEGAYRRWLARLTQNESLSAYLHIPFCDRLCWFCGCNTKQVRRYDPIPVYLDFLRREIEQVRSVIGFQPILGHLHLGGGSPSLLRARDLIALGTTIRSRFKVHEHAEISVEVDPSDVTAETFEALEAIGTTRASIGVQDFDPRVQTAINRPQTFEETARTLDALREAGVTSVNIDALYGLPFQSESTVAKSIGQVVSMKPDRIALFGYAHVPWMKKHQRLIPEDALPGSRERLAQARVAAEILRANGYVSIGIDHFAKPDDRLAHASSEGRLRRNFQGYTDDPHATLLGFGASSIGRLPDGYVQNETPTATYLRRIAEGRLPIARGIELTDADRLNADVIEQLMCRFSVRLSWLRGRHERYAAGIGSMLARAAEADRDGLIEFDGDEFRILPEARAYTRTVASWFDARLRERKARYSAAV